ncbi:type II toxin-antitoxin system ParD family antitoxin [Methylobacterium sp. SyP6R]|uniref:type II toxin-antitoxin system ParD family antitoxin n=1 Tax=Methylobacterium sp. SyP6R TaxID=2718876 RepID=UPI001F384E94|nr:type II toxin-antitoxin system ParD family antitoxin [Methylobacterium sp. SyP6R]MCF4126859.1 type II toxin-antitoxin system ParD family antitoxin [Methylobacterium sp. SyP6R]
MQAADKTTSISLPSEPLRESVAAGEHASLSDVRHDAMSLEQRQREEEHAKRLEAIRARIRRSLDDPRPDLTPEQVDAFLEELFAEAERDGRFAVGGSSKL